MLLKAANFKMIPGLQTAEVNCTIRIKDDLRQMEEQDETIPTETGYVVRSSSASCTRTARA